MYPRLSLSTLLSQALVAFTIEFDNEFEHRVPHRTSDFGGWRADPYLVSMVMWLMVLRDVPEQGITAGELKAQSRFSKKQLGQLLERLSAQVPPREVLPHFPMVLHRGGYPDGS